MEGQTQRQTQMRRIIYFTASGILFASHFLSIYFSILRIYHKEEKSEDIGRGANCSLHPLLKSTNLAIHMLLYWSPEIKIKICIFAWNISETSSQSWSPGVLPWHWWGRLVKVANWQSWYKSQRSQQYWQISGIQNETSKCFAPQLAHYCNTGYLWTAFAW